MVDSRHSVEALRAISHHPILNCFHRLNFGGNKYNIHFATPGELLHMHQKGAMVRAVEALKFLLEGKVAGTCDKQISRNPTLVSIDNLGYQFGILLNRKSDRKFPRTKFKNSLFNKTKKAAHEQGGVCLNLLLAMLSDRGRQVLLDERTLDERNLEDQVYVFELILCFESWLKKASFTVRELRGLKEGLGYYVQKVAEICQRGGMGAKLIKNHLVLHLHHYVHLWGPPKGWDSGPSESHHKTEVKAPSKNTQRNKATFIQQVATRYDELMLVRSAEREYQSNNGCHLSLNFNSETIPFSFNLDRTGATFSIGFDTNELPSMRWNQRRLSSLSSTLPIEVLNFCCFEILPHIQFIPEEEKCLIGFTEHHRTDSVEKFIFRAHPSYKSSDSSHPEVWYDWAIIQFDSDLSLPCQILCFLHLQNLTQPHLKINGVSLDGDGQYAVVRCFKSAPCGIREAHTLPGEDEDLPYCRIVQWGELDSQIYLVSVESIVKPVAVVPNIPISNLKNPNDLNPAVDPKGGYFVISNQDEWGEIFTELMEDFV
jgi:hypothetical protein